MAYVELEQFRIRLGVTRDEFVERDEALQAWSHLHRRGLLRRMTAFGDGDEVLVVTILSGATPPAATEGAVAERFAETIDASSYRRAVYRDRG